MAKKKKKSDEKESSEPGLVPIAETEFACCANCGYRDSSEHIRLQYVGEERVRMFCPRAGYVTAVYAQKCEDNNLRVPDMSELLDAQAA